MLTGQFQHHRRFPSLRVPPRDVLIYLPPGYHYQAPRRYPVLYLQDGQNLFDGDTAYVRGQEWRVDETAERLIRAREVEPLLIVGIYNAGDRRIDEYTPARDARGRGGAADRYAEFLIQELKPFIDSEYRTLTDPPNTGLGGSSLGGLATLHIGLTHPHVFGKLAVHSPSVWWNGREILARVHGLPAKPPLRIWLDIGTREGDGTLADARLLRDALTAKQWRDSKDLWYHEARGGSHSEASWASRVSPMLRWLFPAPDEF